MARKKIARRYTTNEIGRRVRSGRAGTSARGRKNASALTRTQAVKRGVRLAEEVAEPTRVGRDPQAKAPSPTGLAQPPAFGTEGRRPHKPRRR